MRRVLGVLLCGTLVASAASAQADKKTERLWKAKCASCHGADGKAQTDQGKKMQVRDMANAAWQKEVSDDAMRKAIKDGVQRNKDGVKQEMEAFGDTLKPDQIDALVQFIRGLGPK
jgi:mono/diheme cytochrome c family protein